MPNRTDRLPGEEGYLPTWVPSFGLGLLGVLSVGDFASAAMQATEVQETPRARGLALILEDLGALDHPGAQDLVDSLLHAGPVGQAELFNELRRETDALDKTQRAQIERALLQVPRWVATQREEGVSTGRRESLEVGIALRALDYAGSGRDLPVLTRLATPLLPDASIEPKQASRVSETLARLLQSDGACFDLLSQTFPTLDQRIKPCYLLGVGAVESEESLRFLAGQLGVEEDLTTILFSQLGKVGSALGLPIDTRTQTFIEMSLASPDVTIRREACTAIGRLGGFESVPDLIQLLHDEDVGVRDNAHWALEEITAKNLDPDPARWARWYDAERLWWTNVAHASIKGLRSPYADIVSKSLRELVAHPMFRDELALEVAALLHHENHALVAQAAASLGTLGSPRVVGELSLLLEHPVSDVRQYASMALEKIAAKR